MNNCEVIIVGPSLDSMGGISKVLSLYKNSGLINNKNICFLPTYSSKGVVHKVLLFIIFVFRFLSLLIFNKNLKLVHIHSASRVSFFRKSFIFSLTKIFKRKVIFHVHGAEFNVFYGESPGFIKNIITTH